MCGLCYLYFFGIAMDFHPLHIKSLLLIWTSTLQDTKHIFCILLQFSPKTKLNLPTCLDIPTPVHHTIHPYNRERLSNKLQPNLTQKSQRSRSTWWRTCYSTTCEDPSLTRPLVTSLSKEFRLCNVAYTSSNCKNWWAFSECTDSVPLFESNAIK